MRAFISETLLQPLHGPEHPSTLAPQHPVLLAQGLPMIATPGPQLTLKLRAHRLYPKTGTLFLEYDVVPVNKR